MECPCCHVTNAELPATSATSRCRGLQVSSQVKVNEVFGMKFSRVPLVM